MTETTNYHLSQWVKDDRIRMEDFNADNAKIDAALAGKSEVAAGTYKPGILQDKVPFHISLGFRPKAVLIWYNLVNTSGMHNQACALLLDGHPVGEGSGSTLAEVEDDGFFVRKNGSYAPQLAHFTEYFYIAFK